MRVGEKEISEQRRDRRALRRPLHARAARRRCARPRSEAAGDERERLYRLRKTCEAGLDLRRARRARGRARERDPRRARRRSRARSCRCAPRRRSSRCCPTTRDRDELGELRPTTLGDASTTSGSSCCAQARSSRPSSRDRATRSRATRRRRASRCASSSARWPTASEARRRRLRRAARDAGSSGCSAPERERRAVARPHRLPAPALAARGDLHEGARRPRSAWTRSTSSASTSTSEPNIKLDLDDRPQKSPRACVIAADPPKVVHLITRAQGGLHDYQAFLHEAGHALHYAGCRPDAAVHVPQHLARPRADRDLLVHRRGDLARARLARALLRPLRRARPPRTPRRRSFLEALLFRRYAAKLQLRARLLGPLRRGRRHRRRLRGAAHRRRPGCATARDGYLADMDAGFYSADYLRAWIRSAQLRAYLEREVGEDWWREHRDRATGCASSSARARGRRARRSPARIGFDPLDTGPLLAELGA